MPKFREWRSRLSSHGTGFDTKSVRCTYCRNWFQPLSAQEKACVNCHPRRTLFSNGEELSSYATNPERYGPLSTSSPIETSSSSSAQFFFTPNLRTHHYETERVPVAKSVRATPIRNFSSLKNHFKEQCSNDFFMLPSDGDEFLTGVGTNFSPVTRDKSPSRFQRFSSTPFWQAEQEIFMHNSTGLNRESLKERNPRRTLLRNNGTQTCEFSNFSYKNFSKPSIGIQTEPSRNDASVQVELIPNSLCQLFEEHTAIERFRGDSEDVVKLLEGEISALSSDPDVLEFVETRGELIKELRNLGSKRNSETSRIAKKNSAVVAKAAEGKRVYNLLLASKEECMAASDNVRVVDGLVSRSKQTLQHYEDLAEITRQQLLNEKNEELSAVLRTLLSRREKRVALAKNELERNLQQRAIAYEDLRDADQYFRDTKDVLILCQSRVQNNDMHANTAGLVAIEKEADFIMTQMRKAERKIALKLLPLIKKKEDLLRYKFQQSLSGLLHEKKYFAQIMLKEQVEKELEL